MRFLAETLSRCLLRFARPSFKEPGKILDSRLRENDVDCPDYGIGPLQRNGVTGFSKQRQAAFGLSARAAPP